ncbi:MAG TPA: hypothetical protein VN541_11555 [Tepidisphaeraceae bacterium]|nr:hypothetical protein [Tepidisphaeraceae bacterium]
MRKTRILALLLIGSLAMPVMVGCDNDGKTLNKQEKTTSNPDGSQTTTEKKTVQHNDGSVTSEKHTDSTPQQH